MNRVKIGSIIILLGALIASLFSSCTYAHRSNSENEKTETISTEYFNKIVVKGAYDIRLIQSETPQLTITSDKATFDNIDTSVHDSTLYVKLYRYNVKPTPIIELEIACNNIEKLRVEGGIVLETEGYIETKDFDLHIEGGTDADIKIKADNIRLRTAGGVNIEFEGICNDLNIHSEGACNIDAATLRAETVRCKLSGAGNATVYASDYLDAHIEGVGLISYRGNPTVNKRIEGLGLVLRK
jgi:hypothetical protein